MDHPAQFCTFFALTYFDRGVYFLTSFAHFEPSIFLLKIQAPVSFNRLAHFTPAEFLCHFSKLKILRS